MPNPKDSYSAHSRNYFCFAVLQSLSLNLLVFLGGHVFPKRTLKQVFWVPPIVLNKWTVFGKSYMWWDLAATHLNALPHGWDFCFIFIFEQGVLLLEVLDLVILWVDHCLKLIILIHLHNHIFLKISNLPLQVDQLLLIRGFLLKEFLLGCPEILIKIQSLFLFPLFLHKFRFILQLVFLCQKFKL